MVLRNDALRRGGSALTVVFASALCLAVPRPAAADTDGPWSGLYVGAHAGYAWAETDYSVTVQGFETESVSHDLDGGFYGAHVGVQRQWDHIVGGVEVSYSKLDLSDTVESTVIADRFRSIDIDTLFTATARLGYAFGDRLAYVKGGYAGTDVDTAVFPGDGASTTKTSGWTDGWIIGVGFEHLCTPRLVLGIEYDYVKLDMDDRTATLPDLKPVDTTDGDVELHSVTARVSYKFGPDPAPAPLK